jgi:hypothetical protein
VPFVLAICIALGGQVRAVDVDLDDTNEVTSVVADDFIASLSGNAIGPSGGGSGKGKVLPTAPAIGAGRAAVSELFRPPEV